MIMKKSKMWTNWYREKTVLITGATSGIGLAMAGILAPHCAKIIFVGRNQTVLDQEPERLMKDNDVEVVVIRCDFSQKDCVKSFVDELKSKYHKFIFEIFLTIWRFCRCPDRTPIMCPRSLFPRR